MLPIIAHRQEDYRLFKFYFSVFFLVYSYLSTVTISSRSGEKCDFGKIVDCGDRLVIET